MQIEWRLPEATLRQLAGAGVAVVLAAMAFWWFSAPVQQTPVAKAMPKQQSSQLLVDVIGAVRHPGVVRLPSGARVIDAVSAAGGMIPGHKPVVNMARLVVDGEQIIVGQTAAASTSGRVDLNRADVADLDALPGIGPVLAQRIVEYREIHGPFARTRDLLKVPGIGDSKFSDIAAAITA